jgi:hypothetical protein
VFERFTQRARRVMVLAQNESRSLDHDHIGTEHVLIGVAREGEGPAAAVLEHHELTAERLRSQLVPGTTFGESAVPFTPGAKRVLERALHEALALNHSDIEPEHLLLALTGDIPDDAPASGANALLREAAVDPAVLHAELLGLLPKGAARARRFGRRERGERLERLEALEPALVPMRGSPIGVNLPAGGPRCAQCHTALDLGLRYATVDAQPAQGEEAAGPRQVVVVYCGSCGATLGALSP